MKEILQDRRGVVLAVGVALAAGLGVVAGVDLVPEALHPAPDRAATPAPAATSVAAGETRADRRGEAPGTARQEQERLDFRRGFSSVAERISPAVVTIRVERETERRELRLPQPFDRFFRGQPEEQEPRIRMGVGSGFIIDEGGLVVTNAHVVAGADDITVQLSDRREIDEVEVVGTDPQTDVALLRIDASDLRAVSLGHSDSTRVGEWVLAIGSPGFGPSEVLPFTVTAGIVSAKGRSLGILGQRFQRRNLPNLAIESFIQTDAVINRGNSGGPLVNLEGEVIGMNTAIMSQTGGYVGYGFAVPSELIRQVVEDLERHGEVRRAMLGVSISPVTASDARYYGLEEIYGAKVEDFSDLVQGGNPAREAGMRPGDVILRLDGQRVRSVPDLQSKIRAYDPGATVSVTVVHRDDTERETLEVTLGEVKSTDALRGGTETAAADAGGPLGVGVQELTPRLRERLGVPEGIDGVVVTDVTSRRSPLLRAAGALEPGMLILDIDGREIGDLETYREAVEGLEPGSVASVQLYDPGTGQGRFVSVEIPEEE